jgi:hypothetical protein
VKHDIRRGADAYRLISIEKPPDASLLALELYLSLVPPQVRLLISLTFGTGLKGRGVS